MKKLLLLLGGVLAFTLMFTAGTTSAAVVQCKTSVYANSPLYVTSARGLTCILAAREQRRYKWSGKNTFRTPGGYRCTPSGRGKVGYQIRCVNGSLAYRIEFAD